MAKRSTDWEALHRDFRTGKFTHRELADKYGVSHQAVGKRSRLEGWEKDLTEEIRSATNAILVRDLVAKEVAEGSQKVASTVVLAAEQNAEITRSHRRRLVRSWQLAEVAKEKAFELAVQATDLFTLTKLMQAVTNSISSEKTLIELERKVYGIDAEKEEKAAGLEESFLEAVRQAQEQYAEDSK